MNPELPFSLRSCAKGLALLGVLLVPACNESATEPPTSQDAVTLTDAMLLGLTAMPLASRPGETLHVDREVSCPAGGKMTQRGSTSMTAQNDERSIVWDFTLGHQGCTVSFNGETVTTDGSMHVVGSQRVRIPAVAGTMPALLEYESRQQGTATTTHRGTSRTCTLDITQRFDAASNSMHITGTSCGHSIDLRRSLQR